MEPFAIITEPTASLRLRSREMTPEEITVPDFQAYLDRLIITMYQADGVGIASPQVGENIRVIAMHTPQGAECYINPELSRFSTVMIDSEEGCLSVPGKYGLVKRHKKISVRALNRHGRRVSLEAKNFQAIVFQHEIDHLDGILFIDKATHITRSGKKHI